MSENRIIGRAGGLPWHIPEDFKFFKQTTLGHVLIMGRKTYESIGKPLPGRLNVVISRQAAQLKSDHPLLVYCADLAQALAIAKARREQWGDEVFIGGGGEIYRQSIEMVDRIYLTRVHQVVDGDTQYPEFDVSRFDHQQLVERDVPIAFSIHRFDRKSKD